MADAAAHAGNGKVLLVGWDAADWKVIRPLMAAGRMPNISRLVNTGCTASITTLQPSFSPMLWTSIATGKRPFNHGIHGFMEPRPDGRGVQRVTNLSRNCKALWNILGQNGKSSVVVGWWPSYPAEPIQGAMVSDHFHRIAADFKMVPGLVHPANFSEELAALRLNPEELPRDLMEAFVPHATEVDQQRDRRLHSAARIIAECANIHSAATFLMDRVPWDLCAVYFDAVDHFGHGYMKFNPPRRPAIGEEEFRLYNGVLQAGYELHDKMLGTLMDKAAGATVVLISDHGFHPDHLRPTFIPQLHAGPATEHRNNGVFAIAGPGIRAGAELPGVGLLDVAPTVLSLFGLPAGADMEGGVVTGAFQLPPATGRIPSWEKVEGNDGRHPPHMQLDPMAASESLDQLVALGYVEEPDADHGKAVKSTIVDLRTNLAEAYQDAGRHADAIAILLELRNGDPRPDSESRNDQRIAQRLFLSAMALRRTAEMAAIADDWAGRRRELYEQALPKIEAFRSLGRHSAIPGRPAEPLLDPEQRAELKQLRRLCRYDPSLAVYFRMQVLRAQRRWNEALACLDSIPAIDLIRPGLFTDRAELLGRLNRWSEAQQVLGTALALDPTDARIHFASARVSLHLGDFTAAAQSALNGLELLDLEPYGHYLLGIALAKLSLNNQALFAFDRALAINPNFPQAHLWLARTYRRAMAEPQRAAAHARGYTELANRPDTGTAPKAALKTVARPRRAPSSSPLPPVSCPP